MTKKELIQHVEECIERSQEEKYDAHEGSYMYAYADGYTEAARHLLTKIRTMGEKE